MKSHFIKVSSKNKKSILKFSFLIFKRINFKIGSKMLLKNYLASQKRKKTFTILKSPHVNKKAQEQFEIRVFSHQLLIHTTYDKKFIYFLKNLKLRLFPDIRLKIKFFTNKKSNFKTQIFNPYNYKFPFPQLSYNQNKKTVTKQDSCSIFQSKYENNIKKTLKKSVIYLHIVGIYGELFLKKIKSLDSSVGRAKD